MLVTEYVDAVLRRAPGARPEQVERDLVTNLKRLSDRIAASPYPRKGLLRKTFTNVTVTAGEASLPSGMNVEGIPSAEITPATAWVATERVQYLPNPVDLLSPPDLIDFAFFAYEKGAGGTGKLLFRDSAGEVLDGTLSTIIANFDAVIADIVDTDLQDELIALGAETAIVPTVLGAA